MQDRIAMVVLGMHRSGTSAMAAALAASGFQPPRTQMPSRPENAAGYWESPVVADLNDEILAAQDASWDDVFPVNEASLLSNFGVFFLGKAADVMKAEFGDATRIVLKDPRICLLADVWKRVLCEEGFRSHFVLVVRHPGEVAASLASRNAFSRDKSLLLWLSSMISAERKTRGESRSFVLYDDLLADPQGVLDRIEADFGQALPRRTRTAEIEVDRAVKQGLRTHAHGERPRRKGELNRLAQQGYEGFRAAARGGAPDLETFDAVARRLAEIEEVAGGVVSELRLHAHELNARIGREQAGAEALASRVAILEPLAAEVGRLEALKADLEIERTSARAEQAQASELLQAAREAAAPLEQQRDAARAQADALAQDLAAERQVAERGRAELEEARAELARDAEHRQQLERAYDALAHGLAAEQAAAEAARTKAGDVERLLAQMREAESRQLSAHQAQVEEMAREVAAEQGAAQAAQDQVRGLEALIEAARDAQSRQQAADRAEIEALNGRLEADRAEIEALNGRLEADRAEIERLNGRFEAERAAAETALSQCASLERSVARSAETAAAALAKSEALAADLAQAQLSGFELTVQASDLRSALASARAEASDAVAEAERHVAASHAALQARLETERAAQAAISSRLEDTIARLAQADGRQAQALDQLGDELEAQRTAVRLMVGDLVRVTSELDAARAEAADLRGDAQKDREDLLSARSDAARLDARLADERAQAAEHLDARLADARAQSAEHLDREVGRSDALETELATVKETLTYVTGRWWWRAMTRARGLGAGRG